MGLIRILLALSVVAAHCGGIFGLNLVGGQVAVQSFYIISGFYMSLILNEKYIGANNSYRLFITNRFIRLYPIYWVVLLGTVLFCFGVYLLTKGQSQPLIYIYSTVKANVFSFSYLILTNLIIFGQDVVMFMGINPDDGSLFFTSDFWKTSPMLFLFLFIPQAWTLGLELTFYLIAPFVLRKGFKIVIALIILSVLLRLFMYNSLELKHDPWAYRFFPTEVMFFLTGYLSYRLYVKYRYASIPRWLNISILVFMLLFTLVYQYLPATKLNVLPFSFKDLFYFTFITCSVPLLFNFFKKNKLDTKIGELSYPVYVAHLTVALVCKAAPFAFIQQGWAIALITVIAAFLLNKFIASPIEKFRQSRLKKESVPPIVEAVLIKKGDVAVK